MTLVDPIRARSLAAAADHEADAQRTRPPTSSRKAWIAKHTHDFFEAARELAVREGEKPYTNAYYRRAHVHARRLAGEAYDKNHSERKSLR